MIVAQGAPDWEIRIIDFGLAKAREERRVVNAVQTVSGTPGYVSPEQMRGGGLISPSTDLFGVGGVLFRLLEGYAPHAGEKARTFVGAPYGPSFRSRRGFRHDDPIASVVRRLLALQPEARYPSASQAQRAWRHASGEHGSQSVEKAHKTLQANKGLKAPQTWVTMVTAAGPAAGPKVEVESVKPVGLKRQPALSVGRDVLLEEILCVLNSSRPVGPVSLYGVRGAGKTHVLDALCESMKSEWRVARTRGRRGATCPPFEALATLALAMAGAGAEPALWRSAETMHSFVESLGLDGQDAAEDALLGGLLGAGPNGDLQSATMAAHEFLVAAVGDRQWLFVADDADEIDDESWTLMCDVAALLPEQVRLVRALDTPPESGAGLRFEVLPLTGAPLCRLWSELTSAGDTRSPPATGCPADLYPAALAPSYRELLDILPADAEPLLTLSAAFSGDIPTRALLRPEEDGAETRRLAFEVLIAGRILTFVRGACARREGWVRLDSPQLSTWLGEQAGFADAEQSAACWLAHRSLDVSSANAFRTARLAQAAGRMRIAARAWSEAGRLELDGHRPGRALNSLTKALSVDEDLAPDATSFGAAPGTGVALDRPRLYALLAEACGEAGHPHRRAEAARLGLACVEKERIVLRARLMRLRAQSLLELRANAEACAILREAVELIGKEGDPMESAQCFASLGWVLGYRLRRNEEGIELGKQALQIASRIVAPGFRASLCGRLGANYLRAGDWDGQLRVNWEDLRLSNEASSIYGRVRANINLGVCYTNRGDLDRAWKHTMDAWRLAERHGAFSAALIAANNLAMISVDAGRLEDLDVWC